MIPVPVNTSPVFAPGLPCNRNGEYFRHDDCSKYYYCVYGSSQEYSCASGLHWNEKGNLCDWPANAQCTDKKPIHHDIPVYRPTRTTKATTTTTVTHDPVDLDEEDEYEETTTQRRTTRSTTAQTTVKPTIANKPSRKPISSSEPCQSGAYRANIDDCETYFICVNHRWIHQFCGKGFQYDQTANECNLASKVRCVKASRYLASIGKYEKLTQLQLDDPCDG